MANDLVRVRDAARRLGVSYATLKQWIYKGALRTVQTAGGHHRISEAELERFLAHVVEPFACAVAQARHDAVPARRNGEPVIEPGVPVPPPARGGKHLVQCELPVHLDFHEQVGALARAVLCGAHVRRGPRVPAAGRASAAVRQHRSPALLRIARGRLHCFDL